MRIPRNGSVRFVCKDRIARISFPFLHIFGQGDTHPFRFQIRFRMPSCCVIEHDERCAQCFLLIPIDHTLILSQLFPPLRVFIMDTHHGLILCLPFMGRTQRPVRPGQTNIQRLVHRFISSPFPTQISHPMLAFIRLQGIASSPLHIRQCRETTTLVAIPESVTIRQDTSQCTPFQQIITFGYPCLVSTSVQSALTIINHVGHIPLIPFAEHGRAVYFMLVVGRSYSQPIFIRSLGFLINLLHARLRNFTLGVCSQ